MTIVMLWEVSREGLDPAPPPSSTATRPYASEMHRSLSSALEVAFPEIPPETCNFIVDGEPVTFSAFRQRAESLGTGGDFVALGPDGTVSVKSYSVDTAGPPSQR